MTPLVLVMTNAGLARINAAQSGQPVDFRVAAVALSDAAFVAAPTLVAVPGEHRRLDTVSGIDAGDNVTHMVVRDDDALGYGVRGFGIYLADGTLLATYAQADWLVQKSPAASLNLAIDLAFTGGIVAALTFGDTNFLNPPATTATKGVVELATEAEADAGTPGALAITAALLARAISAVKTYVDDAISDLSDAVSDALAGFAARTIDGEGLVSGGGDLTADRKLKVDAATSADVRAGTAVNQAVTPAALASAGVPYIVRSNLAAQNGYVEWSNGFIEQWGYLDAAITGEPSINVAFPIPFKVECFGVSGTVRNTAATNSGAHLVQEVSLSLNGAVVFLQSDNTNTNDAAGGFRWRATGR